MNEIHRSAGAFEGRPWTRRALLAAGGSAALAWALATLWKRPHSPPPAHDVGLQLLRRTTFGPTAAELEQIGRLGPDDYLELALHPQPDPALEARLQVFPTLTASPEALFATDAEQVVRELVAARIIRAVTGRNQLFERLVDFWTDHFNLNHLRSHVARLKTVDDREVIRKHVFGRFEDMLRASAGSPAMLFYLDNHLNVAEGPNENYARELLELHTLGVDGGYSQRDVEELARVLTGWGFEETGARAGHFQFRTEHHDPGEKRVLGWQLSAGGGLGEGEELVVRLARHPSTARHIATKLARHFIAPYPPRRVVDRIADSFTQSGGDLRSTYRALFDRRSLAAARPKLKRPFHYYADLLRKTGARCRPEEAFGDFERPLREMRHIPFQWKTPDGYPDEADHWAPMILTRWKLASDLAHDRVEGVCLPLAAPPLRRELLPEKISESEWRIVSAHRAGDHSEEATRERRALLWSTPSFQWC